MRRTGLPSAPRLTPRFELRPFRRRDVDGLVEAAQASMPELEIWLPWARRNYGRTDAIRFVRDSAAAWVDGRAFDFAIRTLTDPGFHVGNVSVWHTSRREKAGEVGYWIRTSEAGTGVATEATARVMEVAFDELEMHRVTLRIAVGNRASERVAEKLGFVQEGLLRKEVFVRGSWMDHTLWAMLDEEFAERRDEYRAAGWLSDNPDTYI